MRLFISSLAFTEPGTILAPNFSLVPGSLLSGVAGMTVLYRSGATLQETIHGRS